MEVKATLGRALEIGLRIGGFILWMLLWRLGLARNSSPAERFAGLLENLGTSFVKLGQHLSLRSDLFPTDFLVELQKLQDDVRPFPTAEAVAAIEAAFGKPPSLLFVRFDETPLAAASVAQVHTARTFGGHEVVVKVLRPGVALQVDRDMRMFTAIVRFLSHFSGVLHRYRAEEVVREVWVNLRRELDLREEARNVHRFATAFAGSPTIEIPDVIEGMSSETVMVQLRSHGRRVDQVESARLGPKLAQALIDAYVEMFFVMGCFHGDPHPGNLLVTDGGAWRCTTSAWWAASIARRATRSPRSCSPSPSRTRSGCSIRGWTSGCSRARWTTTACAPWSPPSCPSIRAGRSPSGRWARPSGTS